MECENCLPRRSRRGFQLPNCQANCECCTYSDICTYIHKEVVYTSTKRTCQALQHIKNLETSFRREDLQLVAGRCTALDCSVGSWKEVGVEWRKKECGHSQEIDGRPSSNLVPPGNAAQAIVLSRFSVKGSTYAAWFAFENELDSCTCMPYTVPT